MSRHFEELCRTKSARHEGQRLEVPRRFLDEAVRCTNEFVNGLPTELIFNLDEVGISEWEGRTSKAVIIPKSMNAQHIPRSINRNLKHVSVIACISAAGKILTPYIAISQDPLPVRENLKKRGVRFSTDFILKARSKSCIKAEFFLDSIRTVFLLNPYELSVFEEFADEDAILLMDNCPSHATDEVLGLLRDARVRVITWALHMTHIFQQLHDSFFGVLKRRSPYKLPFDEEDGTDAFDLRSIARSNKR